MSQQPLRIPKPDQNHADSGRREVTIGGRVLSYHLREISTADPDRGRATHVVTMRHMAFPQNYVLELDGKKYIVIKSRDPNRTGPVELRRRFVELLCAEV